jgi:hypothetical protein
MTKTQKTTHDGETLDEWCRRGKIPTVDEWHHPLGMAARAARGWARYYTREADRLEIEAKRVGLPLYGPAKPAKTRARLRI